MKLITDIKRESELSTRCYCKDLVLLIKTRYIIILRLHLGIGIFFAILFNSVIYEHFNKNMYYAY